jgi:hypothetical protein
MKRRFFCALLVCLPILAQAPIRKVIGNNQAVSTTAVDFSSAIATWPMSAGNTLPATCTVGQMYYKANATAGLNLYGCTSTNVWTLQGDGSGGGGVSLPSTVNLFKGNGSGGAVAGTPGVDYAPATSGANILKGNNAGGFGSATLGVDYAPPTSGVNMLKGNNAGGFASAIPGTDYVSPSGNVATATALSVDPAACTTGTYVYDMAANGTLLCSTPAGGGGGGGTPNATNIVASGTSVTVTHNAGLTNAYGFAFSCVDEDNGQEVLPSSLSGVTSNAVTFNFSGTVTNVRCTVSTNSGSGGGGTGNVTNSSGSVDPTANCTAGTDTYLQTTTQEIWSCVATNTWKKNLSVSNVGVWTAIGTTGATPATPGTGDAVLYLDSTSKTAKVVDDTGATSTTVRADTGASNQFLTAISSSGVISKAQPSFANLSGSSPYKIRVCELHIWGTGASGVLQNSDDEIVSCKNKFGVTETITAVDCWADAGSPTITPVITGGASILSGALTCGTGAWAAGSLSGTPTLSNDSTLDANITTAGGVATNIRVVFTLTR